MKRSRTSIDAETIRVEAAKYTSLPDFRASADGIARAAKRLGIYDEITGHMERGKKPDGYWTEQAVREAALQCKTRTEFRRRYRIASALAYESGKYDEITAHMSKRTSTRKPNNYWTPERMREAALECTSIKELVLKYPSVQPAAIALGIYDEITAHIQRDIAHKYTLETALNEAKNYASIAEFKNQNQSAYNAIRRLGDIAELRELFSDAQAPFGHWTLETCKAAAAGFETVSDFRAKEPAAYTITKRNGWLEEVTQHLERERMPNGWWDELDNFLERLRGCRTLSEYNKSNMPFVAKRNGWMDYVNEVLPSLIRGATGFDTTKPAIMYYLRVETVYATAYKIGITNRTVQQRFNNDDLAKITLVKQWTYDIGLDAYNAEQEILETHFQDTWMGDPLLQSGNTEMFGRDVLGLDRDT